MHRYLYSLVQATTPAQDRVTVALVIGRDGEPFELFRPQLRSQPLRALGLDIATIMQFLNVVCEQVMHLRSETELVEFVAWHHRSMLQCTMPFPILGSGPEAVAASLMASLGLP